MPQTLSVIKADVGGYVGHSDSHEAVLGFQLADGKLGLPRDLFDDPSFDNARHEANEIADYLRRHGPFEPHRLPLDEMEYTTMPAVAARMEERWPAIE